jgi:hypothetical protein
VLAQGGEVVNENEFEKSRGAIDRISTRATGRRVAPLGRALEIRAPERTELSAQYPVHEEYIAELLIGARFIVKNGKNYEQARRMAMRVIVETLYGDVLEWLTDMEREIHNYASEDVLLEMTQELRERLSRV